MEHKSNGKMKAIKDRKLCTLAFCRIVAMVNSLMFRKFDSYPRAIAVLIVLKVRILQMLLVSHLHVTVSTDFKVLYLGVMTVKIVSWKYYVSYISSRIFGNIGIISNAMPHPHQSVTLFKSCLVKKV